MTPPPSGSSSCGPGITFHDGKPLTAQDVIYTFRRIISNKFSGANSLGPMDLNELKAADQHTVMVKFTSPYGSFVDQLAYWYYLYIVPDGLTRSRRRTEPGRSRTRASPRGSAASSPEQ